MKINFLAAHMPLVKQFALLNGKLETLPYPLVSRFTSFEVDVNTIQEFYAAMLPHAASGNCLLKGELDRALVDESRAGHTSSYAPTSFVLFDLDGIVGFDPEQFMARIGLSEVSYIVQYSASAGVKPEKGLSCHIIMLLDHPVDPSILKIWLTNLNLEFFKADITLNRLGESLHWPIDITTCQNDKLIYIAPPICTPPQLDQFNAPRIQLIQKTQPFFVFSSNLNYLATHHANNLLNELRKAQGLPKTKKERVDKSTRTTYSPDPKTADVTGVRISEEFTHLNLNGGDSWGYYHLTERPKFLYNFKGEPVYKIQELLPEYWRKLQEARDATPNPILALRDFNTDLYYNGRYDSQTDTLTLHQTSSKDKLRDFLACNGVPKPEEIPDWDCTYDPCSSFPQRVDIENLTLNWFVPSEYMRIGPGAKVACPPNILYLIHNVIGNDPAIVDHFLNWVACAYVYRLPNGTAWILQGVPGTGKGMLINEVLRPIFGLPNVAIKRMSELFDKFNEFIERSLICFIDEISIGEDKRHDTTMADLKQQITEPTITIRKMHTAARQVKNHANWIFSTNNKQPIKIEEGDRRYNVGEFCKIPLKDRIDTYVFAASIKQELIDFHFHLLSRVLNRKQASTVIQNEARKDMIERGMLAADVVSKAIREGDLAQIYDWADDPSTIVDNGRFMAAKAYHDLVTTLVMTRQDYLRREDLQIIFSTAVGKVPRESAKFTQYLKHHDIIVKLIKRNKEVFRGIHVKWAVEDGWLKEVQAELSLGKIAPMVKPASPKEDVKDGQA